MLSYVMNINHIIYKNLMIHEIYYRKKTVYIKMMLYIYCHYLNDNVGN
jgi:hypothetical protein